MGGSRNVVDLIVENLDARARAGDPDAGRRGRRLAGREIADGKSADDDVASVDDVDETLCLVPTGAGFDVQQLNPLPLMRAV